MPTITPASFQCLLLIPVSLIKAIRVLNFDKTDRNLSGHEPSAPGHRSTALHSSFH